MTVTFEQVTKIYRGGKAAIENLTLEVETGELLVLIGPSGCGKTTTLRMINRLEEPTSGKITIDGRSIEQYKPVELRRGIGYTVQQTGLFPHMTIHDNIDVVPRLLGWTKERREARVHELLELANMRYDEFAHRYPRQLSGGQQQRIGVLRSLAADPPIILMDEPFGALDPISREALQIELKRLQSQLQKTIVFVTHDIDEALRLGDRIAIFDTGRLVQMGTPRDILNQPKNEFVSSFVHRSRAVGTAGKMAADLMVTDLQLHRTIGDRSLMNISGSTNFFLVETDGTFVGRVSTGSVQTEQFDTVSDTNCVRTNTTTREIFGFIRQHDAVPVLDERNRLVGVITTGSLMDEAERLLGGDVL